MRYNRLGNTGLVVSELCLGTMTFGQGQSERYNALGGLDQERSTALVRQALDAGVNFIDTANVYQLGQSEEFLGRALKDLGVRRADVLIATKAGASIGMASTDAGMSRAHLMNEIDRSLARLGTDHVDLYQLHRWNPSAPVEEAMRALDDIVRSGRARYVGVSNWGAWQVMKALGIAERRNLERLASVQAYYSLVGRDIEREIVPMLRSENVGLMVWSPLASGLLSGKYTREGAGEGRRARMDFPPVDRDRAFAVIDAMRPMADARGISVAQVALAWLLHRPVVSSVIMGARRADQLADNLGASDVELTAGELAELDRLSALAPEYPGWMFGMDGPFANIRQTPRRETR